MVAGETGFVPDQTDFSLSPYTGLTRESWISAGKYLLAGAFKNLKDADSPMVMPRGEFDVTYPHRDAAPAQLDRERRAEMFEGLTRSFFTASVLIHEEPELVIEGVPVTDYYKRHILRTVTAGDEEYAGGYEELKKACGGDENSCFQQTVETCALVIGLWVCREEIWERYSKKERDLIASFLGEYAHAATVPQNWRLFNMLDMAFLDNEGYEIDECIMLGHAEAVLNYYAGDGWYRDGQSFDYYSCWAFNFYGPLWCRLWGYNHAPVLAAGFERASNDLMKTFGRFFGRDGSVLMWGRSSIYRNAVTSAFDGNFFLKNHTADPGWARRISSGALMQFLSRDDFLKNGIPSLGFYGQFEPLIQGYSCAESPFWLGKAFLCIHLPADHPFWTAVENDGDWEKLSGGEVLETVLDGPGLCFSNHEENGETFLRTGKVIKHPKDRHGMLNYGKLCYSSRFPWEAVASGDREGVESCQYVLRDLKSGEYSHPNALLWSGRRDGVLYRREFFGCSLDYETHWMQAVDLADFPVTNGIVRVDRLRLFKSGIEITLGAFGFPDNGTEITRSERDGSKAITLTGRDHTGRDIRLAMTVYSGWQDIDIMESEGTNADSPRSLIVYARAEHRHRYDASEPAVLISQVITGIGQTPFTEEELFAVRGVEFLDRYKTGAGGQVRLELSDGSFKSVDFSGIEGRLEV